MTSCKKAVLLLVVTIQILHLSVKYHKFGCCCKNTNLGKFLIQHNPVERGEVGKLR